MRPEEIQAFLDLFGEKPVGSDDAVANLQHHGLGLSPGEIEEIRFEDGDTALKNFSAFRDDPEGYGGKVSAELQPFLKKLIPDVRKATEKPKKPSEQKKEEIEKKSADEKLKEPAKEQPVEKADAPKKVPSPRTAPRKAPEKDRGGKNERVEPPAQRFDPLPPHVVKVLESQDWYEWKTRIGRADRLIHSPDAMESEKGLSEMRGFREYIAETLAIPGLLPEIQNLLTHAQKCIVDLQAGLLDENLELFKHRYSPRSHN